MMPDFELDFLGGLSNYSDLALLFLRLTIGVFFIVSQGVPKLFGKNRLQDRQTFMGRGVQGPLFDFVGLIELLGGIFILVGFLTRFTDIVLSILMFAVILFNIRVMSRPPVNRRYVRGWDLDTVLLAALVMLAVLGGGVYSLDYLLHI
jgi:uncharacterized membrane protein YphA (DoxX/SURF4 family)